MANLFSSPPSPPAKKKARVDGDDAPGLPSVKMSSPGGPNADANAYYIKAMSVTMNKSKLIGVLVEGEEGKKLFLGGTAFHELTRWLADVNNTLFCVANKVTIPKDTFIRPDGKPYPYPMSGYMFNDMSNGMVYCFAVFISQAVLLTNCMVLTNPGLFSAIEKTFLEQTDPDFKGVTQHIGFRALEDGKKMLEFCMGKIIENNLVKDVPFLKLFAEFRLSSTANLELEMYQAKYFAIRDHEIYKAMYAEHTRTYHGVDKIVFKPFIPCNKTLFEFFFALLPKE